jgi:hypothetical protein
MRYVYKEFPNNITSLVQHIGKDCNSPSLFLHYVLHNTDLHQLEIGAKEPGIYKISIPTSIPILS